MEVRIEFSKWVDEDLINSTDYFREDYNCYVDPSININTVHDIAEELFNRTFTIVIVSSVKQGFWVPVIWRNDSNAMLKEIVSMPGETNEDVLAQIDYRFTRFFDNHDIDNMGGIRAITKKMIDKENKCEYTDYKGNKKIIMGDYDDDDIKDMLNKLGNVLFLTLY